MTLNRAQLIKLLNLTGSEYDAEALNAIRRSNALLRKHRTTWVDLLALPQEPTQARQQRAKPVWERHAQWQGYRATSATKQMQFSRIGWSSLGVLFFPVAVYVWLYEGVVLTRRRRLRPLAMLVPIFGGGTASLIWIFMLLAVAHVMGIA
jgi:hypothetical protein